MLIVSKIIDYYDSIAFSKGVDKTIVYKREQSNHKENFSKYQTEKEKWYDRGTTLPSYNWNKGFGFNYPRYEAKVILVGFCGKVYPVACVKDHGEKRKYDSPKPVPEFIFGLEKIGELFNMMWGPLNQTNTENFVIKNGLI